MGRKLLILCLVLISSSCTSTETSDEERKTNVSLVEATTTTKLIETSWLSDDLTEGDIESLTNEGKLYKYCYPDPTVEECEYDYDGISLFLWEIGAPFWNDQIARISNWSGQYGNPGSERWGDYPQELQDILSSPAFKITDSGEIYDCYLSVPGSTGSRMMGVIGVYPAPLELLKEGLYKYPHINWICYPENESQDNNYSHFGNRSPILRGDFGNHIPDPRYASWFMWGIRTSSHPTNPNNDYPNIVPVEFEILEFFWWYEDGFSIQQFCEKGPSAFSYEEDYESVCS